MKREVGKRREGLTHNWPVILMVIVLLCSMFFSNYDKVEGAEWVKNIPQDVNIRESYQVATDGDNFCTVTVKNDGGIMMEAIDRKENGETTVNCAIIYRKKGFIQITRSV